MSNLRQRLFQEAGTAKLSPQAPAARKWEVNRRMLGIALACGGLASLLVVSYLQSSAGALAEESRLVKVAVAAKDIPARTQLKPEMFSYQEIPAKFVPKGAVTAETETKDLISIVDLYAGEQILEKRISKASAETGLAALVPEGHRAVTMSNTLGKLLKAGDFVDVLATVPQDNRVTTTLALQRAQVLAVGDDLSGKETSSFDKATLAVPDEKVHLVMLLEEKGSFKLVLRARTDESVLPAKVNDQALVGMLSGQGAAPRVNPIANFSNLPAYRPTAINFNVGSTVRSAPARSGGGYRPAPAPRRVSAPRSYAPRRVSGGGGGGGRVTVINGTSIQQQ